MTTFHYKVNDSQIKVQIEPDADSYHVIVGDRNYRVKLEKREDHTISYSVDGRYREINMAPGDTASARRLWLGGDTWYVETVDPRRQHQRGADAQTDLGALTTSMPGQVQEVLVAVGDFVSKGDPLIVLEAMKMEMRISAPEDGVVSVVNCKVGEVVTRGQTLVVFMAS